MKLSTRQQEFFRTEGYLVAENVVTADDLQPVIDEYSEWIDRRARELLSQGAIENLFEMEPFDTRFARLYSQSRDIAQGMDIMHMRGRAMFEFLRNPNLLDAVESLIGPEITCNPIQHIRAKPPISLSNEGYYNVPWHQDMAVTWEEADHSEIITCWIALVDATVENGCMEVLPGVWKLGYLLHHKENGDTTIHPDFLPKEVSAVPVPVKRGGAVFMHRCTPHRSTPNFTEKVRWSLDLRYQPAGTPTGRPFHPEFIARSHAQPDSVLTNFDEWRSRWEEALANSEGARWHRV